MKLLSAWLLPVVAVAIASPVAAEPLTFESAGQAGTATDWIAQDMAIAVTAVQIETTDAGIAIVIETAESLTISSSEIIGNALVTEIPNAVLALSNPDEAEQFAPAAGIALVSVTDIAGGGIQITVTGTEAPPQIEVASSTDNLVFNVVPGVATADGGDIDAIQVVVTGEQEGYYVPDASTATRTDTPLRDIPQSIQVIPQAVLEDQQVFRLNDALRNVSGVVSSSLDQRGQRFIVRGFDNASVIRDGFRLLGNGGNFGFQELSNVERIEVLKGPAAILNGFSEPGGVINLVTEQPLAEPFYQLGFRAGNRELIEPSLDISGPLTDDGSVRYRINALYRNEDFYRDFDVPVERYFIAPVLAFDIGDRTDLSISFEYMSEERPTDFGGIPVIGDRVADIPFDRITGEPDDDTDTEAIRAGYQFEHRFNDDWRIRNQFQFFRFDPTFVSNIGFELNEATGDLTRVPIINRQLSEIFELYTNTVGEFTTGPVEHTLLAGFDLFYRDFDAFGLSEFAGANQFNIFDPEYGLVSRPDSFDGPLPVTGGSLTRGLGIYIQDQVDFSDNFHLLAGVRYDTVGQIADLTGDEQTDDAFSPRVGLVYQPVEPLSLYASYSTSFVPNGGTTVSGDLLEPERGRQFEVGARAELFDDRFVANLALFDITKRNVATFDPESPPGENFSVAVGKQRSRGIELDLIGEPLPGWNLIANYAYTDADITEDNTDIEGNRLFGVPENNFNLWTTYELQRGTLTGLGFGVGVNYVSDRFGDNDNSFVLEDYFLTNAAVYYERDNWRAAVNFRNLFDIDYIDSSEGSRTIENRPGEGFTVLGSFTIAF